MSKSQKQTQPQAETQPKKKRGPIRRLFRLVFFLLFLIIAAVLTLPLWGSTGPGTGLLAKVAGMAAGEKVEMTNLDLGYSGDVLVEGLRFGDELTVEKAELTIGLIDLISKKIRLKGTITRPAYVAVLDPAATKPEKEAPTSGATSFLPDARIDLTIVDGRVELRHAGTDPEVVDRVEGFGALINVVCDGTFSSLQAELNTKWQKIEFGGFPIEPSTLVVKATPTGVTLEPSHLQVAGGTVDVQGTLDLTAGAEKLSCTLTADGIQPPTPELQPIRGVDLTANLTGLDWVRAAIEKGEAGLAPTEILKRLQGSVALKAQQLSYGFPEPMPVLGKNLRVSGLDGSVLFDQGVISTRNMNMLVQDTAVSADLSSTAEGPISFSLLAAAPGKPAGQLPVKNLILRGTAPFSGDQAKVQASFDSLVYEEISITSLDAAIDYLKQGAGHQVAIDRCQLTYDGAQVTLAGTANADEAMNVAYKGTVAVDGYAVFPEKGKMQGLTATLDLQNIPTADSANHLEQIRGKIDAKIASLPTDFADFQNIVLGVDFQDGHAVVRDLIAQSQGGTASAKAKLFLGSTPANLSFSAKATGMTLTDADGPIQNLAATGDLTGFSIIDGLYQPNLGGTVSGSFDKLPLSAVTLDQGAFNAKASKGRIDVDVLNFATGPGKIAGTAFTDLAQQPPEWGLDLQNDKVAVRKGYGTALGWIVPLLAVPAGNLSGELASNLKLSGKGFGMEDLRQSLRGSGSMSLENGTVSGSPVLAALSPLISNLDLVGIESIKASFDVGDGLVRSDDIDMNLFFKDSPIFMGLKGNIDFDTNIDYGIKLKSAERFLPANIQPALQLLGEDATIPLHLQGTLESPKLGFPSLEELMKGVDPAKALGGLLGGEQGEGGAGKMLEGILGGGKEEGAPDGGEKPKNPLLDRLLGGDKDKKE